MGSHVGQTRFNRVHRPDDAVPMLGSTGLALPIGAYGHNFDVVANADKYPYLRVCACRLVAVHFHQQAPEMTLRARVGSLGFFAKSQELAEASGVRAARIVHRFENKASNPFLPLSRPSVGRLGAARDVQPRVKQGKRFAKRYLGLLVHFVIPG